MSVKLEIPIIRTARGGYSLYKVDYYHTSSDSPESFTVPGNSPEEAWYATVRRCWTSRRAVAYHCIAIVPVEKQETVGKDAQYIPSVPAVTMEDGNKTGGW